jgi:hypothetical protein
MKDCGSKVGLPDQWNFRNDPWVPLTELRARWLFDLQCLSWKGKRASALTSTERTYAHGQWKWFMDDGRCFTNHAGTDSHHDYITGVNVGADDMSYQLLLLAGNRVDVVSESEIFPENYFGIHKNYPHRLIRAIDIDRLPSPESVLADPYVCHQCTTIKPTGEHGIFPQFDGRARGVIWARGGSAWIWERLISTAPANR